MPTEKKAKCLTCRHNITIASCGSCVTKGADMVDNIAKELGVELKNKEDDDVATLKQTCKIVIQYPEEYDAVDPYNCKYYMHSAFRF